MATNAIGPRTNLQRGRGTRTKPHEGEIFTLQVPDKRHLFGRVILSDFPSGPMPGAHLVYIYRCLTQDRNPPKDQLRPSWLLLPPLFTNSLGWSKGYFQRIDTEPLRDGDLLPQHCFKRWDGEIVDEYGRMLGRPVEPCGEWMLMSYRMIDDLISDALRIPRAPA